VRVLPAFKKDDKSSPSNYRRINKTLEYQLKGAVGMLLHMNGKFTMGKLKSSLLSYYNLCVSSIYKYTIDEKDFAKDRKKTPINE
jgi:hypothetical protein